MYSQMLADMYDGFTAFTLGLLVTSCTTCFTMGFIAYVKSDDPPIFKYFMGGMRLVGSLTTSLAFCGLLYFSWIGLAGGFIIGAWLSTVGLKILGSDAVTDEHCQHKHYSHQLKHYYCKAVSMPLLIILPLAFGGLLLFEWWGLGAGFIGGALISTLTLTFWGPQKPPQPSIVPDEVATSILQSHHNISRASRIHTAPVPHATPEQPVIIPNSNHSTSAIDIPPARNPALEVTGRLDRKHLPPKKPLFSQSI
jgi:hypothetical protein